MRTLHLRASTFVDYSLWSKVLPGRPFPGMKRSDKNHEARRLFATNLRKLRAARGMTQEDLAAAAEVDRSYISNVENEHKSVSADVVEAVAKVFGLDIFEMFHPDTARKLDAAEKA